MQLGVRFYGELAEYFGCNELELLTLDKEVDVSEVIKELSNAQSGTSNVKEYLEGNSLFAVNGRIVPKNKRLSHSDTIEFLPFISGG